MRKDDIQQNRDVSVLESLNPPFLSNKKIVDVSSNKNVDIKYSAHDTFLEYHSSGTLKIERLEIQINFLSTKYFMNYAGVESFLY